MVTKQTKKTEEKEVKHGTAKGVNFEGRYKQGIGGRKTATAQVRIFPKNSGILVNGKDYTKYFPMLRQQMIVRSPLESVQMADAMGVSVHVRGGGMMAQADAVRNGIARALVGHDVELKKVLRRDGHMTRDPRAVERKHYGLKKARRAPQWAKR
jgi:small subunit ribosomal protein S9